MKITALLAAAIALALTDPAFAQTTISPGSIDKMSQVERTSAWTKLDASKSGTMFRRRRLQGVVTAFEDGKLSQVLSSNGERLSAASGTGSGWMTGHNEPT